MTAPEKMTTPENKSADDTPTAPDLLGSRADDSADVDAFHLDRPGIRTSFDRASASYEAAAVLQAQVNSELIERLEPFKFQPRVVIDLGAGTGRGAEELKRRYRRALVVAVDMAPGMLREAEH